MSNRQDPDPRDERSDPDTGASEAEDAESLPAPRTDRSPEDVIRTVLSALETNDDPFDDAGIRTAFNFAAPAYRSRTGGSLDDFRDHLSGPIRRALVDHREAKRGRLQTEGETAQEKVVVFDEDATTYEFAIERQTDGKYEGCWMVSGIELVYVGVAPDHQHMPVADFDGTEVKCKRGDILRDVLLRASGVSPHNSVAQYANCNGQGLCGTCTVEVVEGDVTEKTAQEKRRLRLPPHGEGTTAGYRLSCQTKVVSDVVVRKHEGMWGQHVEEYAKGTDEDPEANPIRVTDEEYDGAVENDTEADGVPPETGELDLSDEARGLLDDARDMLDRSKHEDEDE